MPLDVIVLAAGQGKRMRSDLPKVLHPIAGRPLLAHVLDAARALGPRKTVVVHGHGAEAHEQQHGDTRHDHDERVQGQELPTIRSGAHGPPPNSA